MNGILARKLGSASSLPSNIFFLTDTDLNNEATKLTAHAGQGLRLSAQHETMITYCTVHPPFGQQPLVKSLVPSMPIAPILR